MLPNSLLMKGKFTIISSGEVTQWRRWVNFQINNTIPPQRVIHAVENALGAADISHVSTYPRPSCVAMDFRDGVVHYAVLEPVEIGGTTVSRATLHNFEEIARKDIRIGDRVLVKRAGDVIPYIVGPIVDARNGDERPIALPAVCPACGQPVLQLPDEVGLYCENAACWLTSMRARTCRTSS